MDHRWVEMQQHPPPPLPIPNPSSSSSSSLDPYYTHYYNQPSSSSSSYPQYYPSSYYNPPLPPPSHPSSHLPRQNPNPTIPPSIHSEPLDYHGGGVPSVHYDVGLMPPGIDSSYTTTTMNSYHPPPHPPPSHVGFEDHASTVYAHPHTQSWTTTSYYQVPNVVAHSLAAKEVVRQYGADPAAYAAVSVRPPSVTESLVPANPNPTYWTNTVARPHINDAIRKKIKKTKVTKVTKIVQSAWCEICKIDCTTRDVLDKHRMGKKHKKNLEKIEELRRNVNLANTVPVPVSVPVPVPVPVPVMKNPVIGPQVNPSGVKTQNAKKSRKKASSTSGEDVETKKRKVLEGGAAAEAVRVCKICNVVCNSQTVFNYHLAGQKHISLAKSRAGGMTTAGA